jgi:hypothetical protein
MRKVLIVALLFVSTACWAQQRSEQWQFTTVTERQLQQSILNADDVIFFTERDVNKMMRADVTNELDLSRVRTLMEVSRPLNIFKITFRSDGIHTWRIYELAYNYIERRFALIHSLTTEL